MKVLRRVRLIFLVAMWTVAGLEERVRAQQTPGPNPAGYPRQSPTNSSSGAQNPPPGASAQQTALEDPILDEADEERNITYMESHVSFDYRHDEFDGGSSGDSVELRWQQSFGIKQRFAAGIKLPFVYASGEEPGKSGTTGFGDMELDFRGMLWKGEKFEHAAGVELTLPSASNDAIGEGQTVIKVVWGFSAQMTPRTLLSGELGYNKTVHNRRGTPEVNSIEPELILRQEFVKRLAGYLDWDNIYEFSIDQYVPTLEAGMDLALDHKDKFTLSPYVVFPLNHSARITETKIGAGFILTYNF